MKKKIVFTFFVGAPGTFDEKCKTIFTKNVKHFYIFRRGSHLYGQHTCVNLWKLGKPVNTLYHIVHLHISHFFGSPAKIIDTLPSVIDNVNLLKCLLTVHHKIHEISKF